MRKITAWYVRFPPKSDPDRQDDNDVEGGGEGAGDDSLVGEGEALQLSGQEDE